MTFKFKTIGRAGVDPIRKIVNETLADVLAEHGLKLELGNARYDDSKIKFGFEIMLAGADPKREAFEMYCEMHGLTPEDFGKVFEANGRRFKLSGYSPRSSKYPFLATALDDGREYKFTESIVRRLQKG